MKSKAPELLPGTLDMLILKALTLEPTHGWGIGQRLQQMSRAVFEFNQGSVYPALQRLLARGWITAEWRTSELGRRARFYRITRSGERQLAAEQATWTRQVEAINWILQWT
jgi:PadR family transcriptional regulator